MSGKGGQILSTKNWLGVQSPYPVPQELCQVSSALLFTVKSCQPVKAGSYLALLRTGLAGNELGIGNKGAASASRIAPGIFPALVTQLVFLGADLGSIRSAGKVETVAAGEPAG